MARMQERLAIPDSNIGRHARTMHPIRECQTPGRERIMTQLTLQSIDAIGTCYTQVVIDSKKPERTEISPQKNKQTFPEEAIMLQLGQKAKED